MVERWIEEMIISSIHQFISQLHFTKHFFDSLSIVLIYVFLWLIYMPAPSNLGYNENQGAECDLQQIKRLATRHGHAITDVSSTQHPRRLLVAEILKDKGNKVLQLQQQLISSMYKFIKSNNQVRNKNDMCAILNKCSCFRSLIWVNICYATWTKILKTVFVPTTRKIPNDAQVIQFIHSLRLLSFLFVFDFSITADCSLRRLYPRVLRLWRS